jgi:hypothetical protein
MKTPRPDIVERRPAGSREEIAEILAEQLARDDLSVIQFGEGPERIIVAGPQTRHCGDCEFCCSAAGINQLEKPPMVRCRYLAKRPARGCGIYPDRPEACAKFNCAWLLGNFDNRYRPDKIGAYVAFFLYEGDFYAVVQVDSRRLDKKRLSEMVAMLHRRVPEVRILYDDKHGTVLRWGEKPLKVLIGERAPGEYEELPLLILDEEG